MEEIKRQGRATESRKEDGYNQITTHVCMEMSK
jgi:hypothetical protein